MSIVKEEKKRPAKENLAIVPAKDFDALRSFGKNDAKKLRDHLGALAAFLGSQGENTRRAYAFSIRSFFQMHGWICPEDVTVAHVVAWKKSMQDAGKSDATVQARLAALTSYFAFLMLPQGATSEPLVKANPALAVNRDDVRVTPFGRSHVMDWQKFETILKALDTESPQDRRDRAILIFFAYTGRRRSEVAGLRIQDLKLDSKPMTYTVMVKGHKQQTFELPKTAYEALVDYWKASGRWGKLKPDHGVFCESKPNIKRRMLGIGKYDPLDDETLRRVFIEAAKRAGFENDPQVHPHAIRHMVARDMMRAGVPMDQIQEALGHSSLNTTQIYTKRLGTQRPSHEDALIAVRSGSSKTDTPQDQ